MANPTKDKTWEYSVNNGVLASSAKASTQAHADKRGLLFGIKEAMIDAGTYTGATGSPLANLTVPWTVQSSSDGSTSGASDLWVDIDDMIWSTSDGGARSWIVLRQTGISTTFELLIDCRQGSNNDDGGEIDAYVAQSAFTGGSTTARPTSTDERQIRNLTNWGGGSQGTTFPFKWHFQISSDGQCTRVYVFHAITRVPIGFWIFDKPKTPTTGWTDPYVAAMDGSTDSITIPTYARFNVGALLLGRFSGADTTMYISAEGFGNVGLGAATTVATWNQLDGTYIAGECGVESLTSTFRGSHGTLFDLWWGFDFAIDGQTYPDDSTRAFAQFGAFIIPWNGDLMQIN